MLIQVLLPVFLFNNKPNRKFSMDRITTLLGEHYSHRLAQIVDEGPSWTWAEESCGCVWSRNPQGDGPYTLLFPCPKREEGKSCFSV